MRYQVDERPCSGCAACADACPRDAIKMEEGHAFILHELCADCGDCVEICPEEAIRRIEERVDRAVAPATRPAMALVPAHGELVRIAATPLSPPATAAHGFLRSPLWPAIDSALVWVGRELIPELWTAWQSSRPSGEKPDPPAVPAGTGAAGGRRLRQRQRRGRG